MLKKNRKENIQDEINEFLQIWTHKELVSLLKDLLPLWELYDVDENDDWLKDLVGEENEQNVRIIRTVYLISIIAERHSGSLSLIKLRHKNLFQRLEQHVDMLS